MNLCHRRTTSEHDKYGNFALHRVSESYFGLDNLNGTYGGRSKPIESRGRKNHVGSVVFSIHLPLCELLKKDLNCRRKSYEKEENKPSEYKRFLRSQTR